MIPAWITEARVPDGYSTPRGRRQATIEALEYVRARGGFVVPREDSVSYTCEGAPFVVFGVLNANADIVFELYGADGLVAWGPS